MAWWKNKIESRDPRDLHDPSWDFRDSFGTQIMFAVTVTFDQSKTF